MAEEGHDEFAFDAKSRRWLLGDQLLHRMSLAASGDVDKLHRLARAFFWHEYLHVPQRLTRYTAEGVGAFANCLERIDYMADTYSILHQADYILRGGSPHNDGDVTNLLGRCITDAIDSFWTFEPRPPIRWWQQRRLRRYLNWYWRREQIENQPPLPEAITLLCRPPVVEIAGVSIATDRRRILLDLGKIERSGNLEVGIVSEKNQLIRCPESTTLSVSEMLKAFAQQRRGEIDAFFAALYDHASR